MKFNNQEALEFQLGTAFRRRTLVLAADKLWMKDGEFLFFYDIMIHQWSKIVVVAHKRFEIIEHELFHSGETIALLKTHEDEYIDLEELRARIQVKT